jgi:CheY-like chemotaxis protein
MKTGNHRVLIIDDERPVLMTLEALLKRHGYHVDTAPTASQGLKLIRSKPPTLILLDLQLPDADGLETLDQIKTEVPQIQVIILTAHDSLHNAIESIKRGAYHFISKPYAAEELLSLVEKALEKQFLLREAEELRVKTEQLERRLEMAEARPTLIFKSKSMQEIDELINAMAPSDANALIVGESGVARVVQKTCELMREHKTEDVRRFGGIDLATVQRYLNFHFSVSLDLFGSEISTNAANFYTAGLKGRFEETKKTDDHRLREATYPITCPRGEGIEIVEEPALTALNERLRDDYVADCQRGVDRWNKVIRQHDFETELKLPHRGFHRAIGNFSELRVSPDGRIISQAEWDARHTDWLPTPGDQAFIASLMTPVVEPGRYAGWIAPPARGINGQPAEFEYVRLRDGQGA